MKTIFSATMTSVVAITGLILPSVASSQLSFTGLGAYTGYATGVSDDGSVVVGEAYRDADFHTEAFRWTKSTGAVGLVSPPGHYDSIASAVSGNGSVVVGRQGIYTGPGHPTAEPFQAFRWTSSTGPVVFGPQPGGTYSTATGASADGSVVVGFGDSHIPGSGFRWTASGGFQVLNQGWANGVSADGSIVVGTTRNTDDMPNHWQAYRWSEDTGTELLDSLVPGKDSSAQAISSDGSLIVGSSATDDGFEATLWNDSGVTGLGRFGATRVTDDGSLVIGTADVSTPIVWTPESGMRSLVEVLRNEYGLADQLVGWELFFALDMSPDGRFIVGQGRHENQLEAWLLDRGLNPPAILPPPITPVPEPAVYGWIGATGLIALIIRRQRAKNSTAAPVLSRENRHT